jgi:hypothetical protein
MRIIILIIAVASGLPIFIGGIFLFPDVRLVLDKDPNAPLDAFLAFGEILSLTILVSVTCSTWTAKLLRVPGFHPGMARAWSTMALVPTAAISPLATAAFCLDKDWFHAGICALTTVGSVISIVVLNRLLRAHSSGTRVISEGR